MSCLQDQDDSTEYLITETTLEIVDVRGGILMTNCNYRFLWTAVSAIVLAGIMLPAGAGRCDLPGPLSARAKDDLADGDALYNKALAFHKENQDEKALSSYAQALAI